MTTPSKPRSHFEQLLSEIYARRSRENNQKACIDCLKPISNKNKFESKNYICTEFCVLYYKNSSSKILSSLQYIKMAVSSKIKSHSDAVDYCKELSFYNNPIKKLKVKRLKNTD